ncbi:MAG: aldehyde ferredoxin oxidoreductase C-terminal domain-containing protein, partial [Pseudomonadota bacterium]
GRFGGELKLAGWDFVILEGCAPKPVYLFVENEHAELLDAEGFIWGNGVWDTEDKILARHGDPQIKVCAIGVPGEQRNRYTCLISDKDRAAGRSGVGAVMGAKLCKAIAVRGTRGVAVRDPAGFKSQIMRGQQKLSGSAGRKRLADRGTHPMLDVTNAYGSLPTRNCRDVQFEGVNKVNAASTRVVRESDSRTHHIRNKACFACTIGCGRIAQIDPEHFSVVDSDHYRGPQGGLEYESIFALAPMVGVDDIDAAQYANMLCNDHSMDPLSLGGTISAAMELFESGAMTTQDTDGVELRFGDAKVFVAAAEAAAFHRGNLGELLAMGSKRLCDKFKRPEFSMTVKGQEFAAYDPRAMQGMGLGYATSNRGACHLRADPYADDFEHIRADGKAKIVKDSQDWNAALDSTGMCSFTYGALGFDDYAAHLDSACEGDWDKAKFLEVGERIWNLERDFNNRAGFTDADDTLPERVLKEPATSGAGKGWTSQLDQMLPEYYELRGWTAQGQLTPELKSRLQLY